MNAIQRHHKCTYTMCYLCKIEHEEKTRSRQTNVNVNIRSSRFDTSEEGIERRLRDKMNNRYDNDSRNDPEELKYSCRHNDKRALIPFMDTDYFNSTNQEKIKTDDMAFPVTCGECGKRLKGGL